jgi:hypothetical protein
MVAWGRFGDLQSWVRNLGAVSMSSTLCMIDYRLID